MGGVRAPASRFHLKPQSVPFAEKVEVIKEVIKEVPCSKQSAELEVIRQRLAKEGETCLSLRMEVRGLEIKASELDRDNARLKAIVAMAEKRLLEAKNKPTSVFLDSKEAKLVEKEVQIPVLDKKMLIIYTLAALASGLGIGVLL